MGLSEHEIIAHEYYFNKHREASNAMGILLARGMNPDNVYTFEEELEMDDLKFKMGFYFDKFLPIIEAHLND